MKMIKLRAVRKFALIVFSIVALISMWTYGALENTYVNYPRDPDPTLLRIVPHVAKGVTVYITRTQNTLINSVTICLVVSGMLAILMVLSERVWPCDGNA
jgi:hypothetical protein